MAAGGPGWYKPYSLTPASTAGLGAAPRCVCVCVCVCVCDLCGHRRVRECMCMIEVADSIWLATAGQQQVTVGGGPIGSARDEGVHGTLIPRTIQACSPFPLSGIYCMQRGPNCNPHHIPMFRKYDYISTTRLGMHHVCHCAVYSHHCRPCSQNTLHMSIRWCSGRSWQHQRHTLMFRVKESCVVN